MNSTSEYQAIAVGPEEVVFKPDNHHRSRFFSLIHLTPPKAAVLATTIVCITFAVIHFNGQSSTRTSNEWGARSLVKGDRVVIGPSLARMDFCDFLKGNPNACSNPVWAQACQTCGISRQSSGQVAPFDSARMDFCDFLKGNPNACSNPVWAQACQTCGISRQSSQ